MTSVKAKASDRAVPCPRIALSGVPPADRLVKRIGVSRAAARAFDAG